jgi:hypothetical protein
MNWLGAATQDVMPLVGECFGKVFAVFCTERIDETRR